MLTPAAQLGFHDNRRRLLLLLLHWTAIKAANCA